ncbi:hypothetical protein GGQ84_001374 [Desulfitispora alkaliphila]|uniref:hypothetical protein n=1 Tax=Desulfitispora alkaliphila TaxID=622674 RepID=UPI003D2104FD
MDASLDTDIVIHLYKSGKRDLLFSYCDKLYMHEYLLVKELKNKSNPVYEQFLLDVENELITIIYNSDLVQMEIKGLFEGYKEDYNYLFDAGELHAVALAKAMGIVTFLSDDTKEFGPHETLVQELIEDVIPFSFYELLFLKYLESDMDPKNLLDEFENVNSNSMSQYPMNFRTKMLSTVRRFSKKYGTERDKQWIDKFCSHKHIDYKSKMRELGDFLRTL